MRKSLGIIIGAALVAIPVFASAQTTSVESQIQALLAQIQQLKAQIIQLQAAADHSIAPDVVIKNLTTLPQPAPDFNISPNGGRGFEGSGTTLTTSNVDNFICIVPQRRLAYGARGSDVNNLQAFLNQQGLLSTAPTGFFGTQTENAVRELQKKLGIISSGSADTTGFGAVGPATIIGIGRWCGGGNGDGRDHTFSATPSYGSAPLAVSFSYLIGGDPVVPGNYRINFGDGSSAIPSIDCGVNPQGTRVCLRALVASHTYTLAGTYTATLVRTGTAAPVASATIVVVAQGTPTSTGTVDTQNGSVSAPGGSSGHYGVDPSRMPNLPECTGGDQCPL